LERLSKGSERRSNESREMLGVRPPSASPQESMEMLGETKKIN
jgi:hypothetical protein